jgi:hypothetical protein
MPQKKSPSSTLVRAGGGSGVSGIEPTEAGRKAFLPYLDFAWLIGMTASFPTLRRRRTESSQPWERAWATIKTKGELIGK